MFSLQILDEIKVIITKAERILVVTHVSPDGDAISSLTAFGLILQQFGKDFDLVCDDGLPIRFSFLPISEKIVTEPSFTEPYHLVVALDAADESRMGDAYANLPSPKPPILNIDHHITNTNFGRVNLIVPQATATAEILFHLAQSLDIELTVDLATSLLTGIVTDTLSFRTAGVTAATLKAAGILVDAGADLYLVTAKGLDLKPLSTLLVWQKGLDNMKLEDGVIWTTISNEERENAGHNGTSSFGLGNLLAETYEAAMSAVLLELSDGQVSVGFRSRPPYSVSEVARSLGGGGHSLAAGCTVSGPLKAAEELIISRAKESIREQRFARKNRL